ncbi:hypothetical protein HYV74_05195 [Candidatus Uhrbacteria bacterium]|nr:hypothetical protein [Candidatus Uhrbacteria bacterium]
MQSCITCGMPFVGDHVNDIGLTMAEGPVCKFDIQDGALKRPEDIFMGGTEFFLHAVAQGDRELAERLTRKNMNLLPYWKQHPFPQLHGAEATDEEFAAAVEKL